LRERIRPATPEEIEKIAAKADLTPRSAVWALGESIAVTRLAAEIDPVFYGEGTPTIRKAWFIWGLENMLKGNGYTEYYFNVPVRDEEYVKIVKGFGAEQTSLEPEFRFKKVL